MTRHVLRGESIKQAKLTASAVRVVRSLPATYSSMSLAKVFGVGGNTLTDARKGNTWAHVHSGPLSAAEEALRVRIIELWASNKPSVDAHPPALPGEEWRPVPDSFGLWLSSMGRAARRGKLFKPAINSAGYQVCSVNRQARRVARLICLIFYGPPPSADAQADHINRVRHDDRLENLRWLSRADNLGRRAFPSGERHWNSKLTSDQVASIRLSAESSSKIAPRFGVSSTTVRALRRGVTYSEGPAQ